MTIFIYDKSFEGLLTCVFEAYERKLFPDVLLGEEEPLPLFHGQVVTVIAQETKSQRVWKALEKKLSQAGISVLTAVWLSELPETDMLLFDYMRKALDSPSSIVLNFGDADVLKVTQIAKKVSRERHRLVQFVRFQKTADGIFFAALEPLYNVLPLAISHFQDRFADQKWLIYDLKRQYGYSYDLHTVTEVRFDCPSGSFTSGKLPETILDENEKQFQNLWKAYFKSIGIKERVNPKLHRQNLPVRFWKYLTEKQ